MTSHLPSARPPMIAHWLISLFAIAETGESMIGDLQEEFALIAAHTGANSARDWYWRQTIKTVPRLAGFGLRTSPWITITVVAGGFLLRKLVAPLVEPAIFAVLQRYPFIEQHFNAYLFFASTGIDIGHLITFLLIGFVVAFIARQREVVGTIALALIWATMALVGSTYAAIRTGNYELLWRLAWYFADSLAIVAAGATVRMYRLTRKPRPSAS